MNNLELMKTSASVLKENLISMSHTVMTSTSVDSVLEDTNTNLMKWAPYLFTTGLIIVFLLMAVGPDRVKQGARDNFFWIIVAMVGLSCVPALVEAFL